jgi:8-oxo-dGTP diphosphatase
MSDKIVRVGFGILLMKDGKILLGKRHDDPEKADSALHGEGTWTMPGGKMDFGETFENNARREVLEETGIVLNKIKIMCVNQDIVHDAHFVTLGMFSEDFEGEPQVLEPDEITEWRWFEMEEVPEKLFFASAKILKNYKEKKFYIE